MSHKISSENSEEKEKNWTVAEKQLNSVTVFIEICSLPVLLFPKHIILASSLSDLTEDDLKKKKTQEQQCQPKKSLTACGVYSV